MLLHLLLVSTSAASSPSTELQYTLTPCAANSFRVHVALTSPPSATVANQKALESILKAEGLHELPGAFVCAPGNSVTLSTSVPSAANGNLRATLSADGSFISFARVDTDTQYFDARPTLAEPPTLGASCTVGDLDGGNDLHMANLTIEQATRWCEHNASCAGFTTRQSEPAAWPAAASNAAGRDSTPPAACTQSSAVHEVFFKSRVVASSDGGAAVSDGASSHWWRWVKQPGVKRPSGYLTAHLSLNAGDSSELIYGLGQGEWSKKGGGCPEGPQEVVPLARNGQTINLLQTKFHVTIPTAFSSAGYGFVFNMPGYGQVALGDHGIGGMEWQATVALFLDFWVGGLPAGAGPSMAPLHAQYADATGHAPMLREDAMLFWQSRNRYKSTEIALGVARKYEQLKLPVGVLVIDYKNMVHDGDFVPDASCYPSVKDLTSGVTSSLNATTVFSFWPEVLKSAKAFAHLNASGCLINKDLAPTGYAIAADKRACRELIWRTYLRPNYYANGVTAYWLDETDGEGTDGGYNPFAGGYETQFGPKAFASNLWVNQYLSIFTEPIRALGVEEPLVLVRGVWAGGQRHGAVLWSSDIQSNFETLAAMVPQGVHASMSGIPW